MSERLTDEQVASLVLDPAEDALVSTTGRTLARLAREVQAWRTLVNGGPCGTCDHGRVPDGNKFGWDWIVPCPDCDGTGARPGLITRLEAIQTAYPEHQPDLRSIIADLRGMTS